MSFYVINTSMAKKIKDNPFIPMSKKIVENKWKGCVW